MFSMIHSHQVNIQGQQTGRRWPPMPTQTKYLAFLPFRQHMHQSLLLSFKHLLHPRTDTAAPFQHQSA